MRTTQTVRAGIVHDYLAGNPASQVAAKYGVSQSTAYNVLRAAGCERRPASVSRVKRAVDVHYFRDIDTEEKAYWLGFVAADGNVNTRLFQMRLAARDGSHLELFRKCLSAETPVTYSAHEGRRYANITITRPDFVRHLNAHGIHPRKSWNLTPWHGPPELLRHYWRGFFDGDGSIYQSNGGRDGRESWGVGVVGTREMCEGFSAFVSARTGASLSVRPHRNIWRTEAAGIEYPQIVARLLYTPNTISLPRKQTRVDRLLRILPERSRFNLVTVGGVTKPAADWAAHAGGHLSRGLIVRRLKRGMSPEQATTTRNLRVVQIEWNGVTKTLGEWAKYTGVRRTTLGERLKRGDAGDRLFRPV